MAVRTTQEIIDALKESFGESPDDKQLAMLEDVSDTFSDLNEKCSEDWKTKYEENDKAWKKKYVDRFFNGASETDGKKEETHSTKETLKDVENENKNDEAELKYDGLFSGAEETNKGGEVNA